MAAPEQVGASGENFTFPEFAIAEALFLAPAWIFCAPPVVVIA